MIEQKSIYTIDEIVDKIVVDTNGNHIGHLLEILADVNTGAINEIIVRAKNAKGEFKNVTFPFNRVESIADYVVVNRK